MTYCVSLSINFLSQRLRVCGYQRLNNELQGKPKEDSKGILSLCQKVPGKKGELISGALHAGRHNLMSKIL